ncbi:hypothetical protein GJ744_004851 [Endocarpon pusillum]|uniref:Ubiquinol-cytochrome c chaperone domain-containing protein n=1 Tax=Endocarpon pusillum TaxID=364733 RepID=A0A8H7E923_9EURO|nr:hypothetical protein GJ744_004851 [Endocarpon pusillum]
MASPRTCSQCFRLVRRQTRYHQAAQLLDTPSPSRAFSSQFRLLQQTPQARNLPPEIPSVPPTTTGTITSNITAQTTTAPATNIPPSPSPSPSPSLPQDGAGPSTSEMQRTISSTISSSSSLSTSLPTTLATRLRNSATKTTDPYIAYGVTQSLFRTCSAQANYTIPESQRPGILSGQGPPKTSTGEDLGVPGSESAESADSWWFTELGLQPTFSTWSQVTYLHMYLLVVRFRAMEEHRRRGGGGGAGVVARYQLYLLDHFSHAAEDRMALLHGMSARGIRNRYLKDLFLQWRGVLAAYDEGLVKGDAVLAGAVWRNLWKGDEAVDWEKVARVVGFVRRAVQLLGQVADAEVEEKVALERGGLFQRARLGVGELVGKESAGIRHVPGEEGGEEGGVPASR